ncbi:MAG: cytochrome c3 family protein [Bacteroidales bacterium]
MTNNYLTIKTLQMTRGVFQKVCFFVFLVIIVFANKQVFTQTITLNSTNPAVPATTMCPGSTRIAVYKFTLVLSAATPIANLTGLNFTTNAGYTATDITRFQLYSSTTNSLAGATQLGSNLTTSLGPGLHTFATFTRSLSTTIRYFWITIDVAANAVANNVISVPLLSTSNLIFSAGTLTGSAFAGDNQTVNVVPAIVTVTGGGTYCGISPTLNATGGSGGTIYWQNTTTNGVSTTTPSTSQVVAASGTYYYRAYNGSCWGTQGSAVVVINPTPAITFDADPAICKGITTANLSYSATTGSPNQYSIVFNSAALSQGFVNVTNALLPASQIVLNVPLSAAAGIYNYSVTVRNSTTNCVSSAYSKTITINPLVSTPGIISGSTTPSPLKSGLIYSVVPVLNATTYSWTVPAGWSITNGQGTSSITVSTAAVGQNGNISVISGNLCGNSAASSLTVIVTIPDPHNVCNQCHINHSAPGGQLTSILGNANLCISCHNPTGSASLKPFANSDKAIPGIIGTSHSWDKAAINSIYQTHLPSDSLMLTRINSGQIICSTCHNQHSQTFTPYLRNNNTADLLCKDCHSARNVGRYLDNTSMNRSSHPVGITYNASDPRFLPIPSYPVVLANSKVECSSCHKVHYAATNDGNILRMTNSENLCQSCHAPKTTTTTMEHKGMTCISCHDVHQNSSSNIYLIRSSIVTPNSGIKPIVFTANTVPNDFVVGSGNFNGVCEVCHTLTDHYTNTSGGTSDARHFPASQNCLTCHPHNKGFAAQTDCFSCHNSVADKPGVGPSGGRRQIVDNTGDGLGSGGDFKRYSHHISSTIPTISDCIKCHYMGDHKDGTVKLLDPDQGFLNIYTYDAANKSGVENFCINCHDANGSNGDLTPFSDGVTVPEINQAMWAASAHKTAGTANANTCLACHDNGHGSNKSTLIGPFAYSGPGTGTDLMNEEEGFCMNCHGASGIASVKVHLAFSGTNTATNFYKHDPNATYRKHLNGETLGASFGGANRHVECVDCHNPHGTKAGTATAPVLLPALTGATGVEPTYAGAGAPTGFVWKSSVNQEYQVCYKCHSSFTTLPTYIPGGWNSAALQADGLKKLTTIGTNGQVGETRDMAQEYNPNNASYHPVMAAGTNLNINAGTFQTGYTYTSRIYCSSCHSSDLSATPGYGNGPHGSSNLHLLDGGSGGSSNYKTVHNEVTAVTTAVCTKCHQITSYYTGNTNSRFGYHLYHVNNKTRAECYLCHDTHGSEQLHLINFNRNGNTTSCISAATGTSQSAFVHAAGTAANTCNLTCHGTSHGGGKIYNPAYN